MAAPSTNDILNDILLVHNRSLVRYLHDAVPWLKPNEDRVLVTLQQIATDQEQMVDRLGRFIEENGGHWDMGEYPMVFTAYHDVAFDWLLPVLIDRQQKTVSYLQRCVEQLSTAPMAKAIAEETVGLAKGHLELLEELKYPPKEGAVTLKVADTHDDHGHHDGHHAAAGHH